MFSTKKINKSSKLIKKLDDTKRFFREQIQDLADILRETDEELDVKHQELNEIEEEISSLNKNKASTEDFMNKLLSLVGE